MRRRRVDRGLEGLVVVESRRFLFLHGWPNRRPVHHWQWWAVEELRRSGEQVLYPQLPDPDLPSRELWTEVVIAELRQLGDAERVVVAHSLSALLWLHVAPLLAPDQWCSRVLLVAPPAPQVVQTLPVAEFADLEPHQAAATATASGRLRVVTSDNDPYCPDGPHVLLERLGLRGASLQVLRGQGHLDPDAGYGSWPSLVAWCRNPADRLVPRPHPEVEAGVL